jgi:hypothetical protein
MTLALRSLHPLINADGSWDSRYPLGDKPQVSPATLGINQAAFNAASITLTNRAQNSPVLVNYRTFLTGTSASTATLTVNAISGTLAGWSIDNTGNNLANPGNLLGNASLQVVAQDSFGNISSFPVQAWSIVGAATRQKIKSNFGLYIYLDRNTNTTQKLSRMSYFSTKPAVIGFQDICFWSKFENPTVPGDYSGNWDASGDSGFKYVDKMLAACAAMSPPRHWMMHLTTYGFAGSNLSTSFPSSYLPSYLSSSTYGPNTASTNGIFGGAWINCYNSGITVAMHVRWWTTPVMNRLIALLQAYGARYDAHPLFEMCSVVNESTVATQSGYSDAQSIPQYQAMFPAGRASFPTTQLRFWLNYIGNQYVKTLIDLAVANFWAIGGPDCVNETGVNPRPFATNKAYRGINPNTGLQDSSYTNYVGKGVWVSEFEPDEEGPRSAKAGTNPPDYTGNPALGDGNWTNYVAQAVAQGAQYITCFDNGYTGNNTKRFQGYWPTQPSHPDALDFWNSVFLAGGGNSNGAQANITLPMTPPSLWPQGT